MRRSSYCTKLMVLIGIVWSLLWFFGLFILSMLQLPTKDLFNQHNSHSLDDKFFTNITIFSVPAPMNSDGSESVSERQQIAVKSWLAISRHINVVFFGKHPSIFDFATRLGSRVRVESTVDFTFLGTPFFHSMVARIQASDSGISVLVDPETILLPDFISALYHVNKLNHDWFMASVSKKPHPSQWSLDGENFNTRKLQESTKEKMSGSNCIGRLLVAWNKGESPLHAGVIPPFIYGKGNHNEWLANEVLSSDFRLVIDASAVISNFVPEILDDNNNFPKDKLISGKSNWEYAGNYQLAVSYGSVNFLVNKSLDNMIKLMKCFDQYHFISSEKCIIYPLNGPHGDGFYTVKPDVGKTQHKNILTRFILSRNEKKLNHCVEEISLIPKESKCSVKHFIRKLTAKTSLPLKFPFSLTSLLETVADKDNSVVLAVAGDNYRDMLMSWVCRLGHLKVTNFIVGALDPEVFRFSVLQGLPVFKASSTQIDISFNNCHFGTDCFQKVTKVKSRIVLKILRLGYNVLMSDVDVYWFTNPLPLLKSFGPGILLAQSDEYNKTAPINLPRRLNSGFYFAHSDPSTISAIDKVVKHASKSKLSEQPSFYDVLCGERGVNRVGPDRCREPKTNLTVLFLDRDRFPNGAYKGLWEKKNVKSACMKQGCAVLHNNWISGRKRKLNRQIKSGLWEYDTASRQCLHKWNKIMQ